MDHDLRDMLERQATWQGARADIPWAEKLRAAVVMRRTMVALRKERRESSVTGDKTSRSPSPDPPED
jgi:hypothetical protein